MAWFIPTETMATISALHYYARWLLHLDNALLLVPVTRMRKENGVVWLRRPDLPKVEYDARFDIGWPRTARATNNKTIISVRSRIA